MVEDEKAQRAWADVRADLDAAMADAFAGVDLNNREAVETARKRLVASHPELFAELNALNDADMAKLRELLDADSALDDLRDLYAQLDERERSEPSS